MAAKVRRLVPELAMAATGAIVCLGTGATAAMVAKVVTVGTLATVGPLATADFRPAALVV